MKNTVDIVLPIILIAALILLANPYMFWMPSALHMAVLVFFIIAFVLFSAFVWKEHAADERENLHRFIVGRFAFLTMTSVLVIGVTIQTINHTLDIWLVAALVAGILAKVIGGIYTKSQL